MLWAVQKVVLARGNLGRVGSVTNDAPCPDPESGGGPDGSQGSPGLRLNTCR